MELSQILIQLMMDRGVTSYRIARDTGVSARLVDYWKKGEKMPGAENLKKLADYFCVSTDYLLGKEKKEKPAVQIDDELLRAIESDPTKRELARWISQLEGDDLQRAAKVLAALLQK